MTTVILRTTKNEDVYINPEYVESITGDDNGEKCYVHTMKTVYEIKGHKHLVASILETERERPDKFVSYKDWDWKTADPGKDS